MVRKSTKHSMISNKDGAEEKERCVSVDLRVLNPGCYLERHLSDIIMRLEK